LKPCRISITKEDLQRDGFHAGQAVQTEVRDQVEILDIFEAKKITPEGERKPHLMHQTFLARISQGVATSFASEMVAIVRKLERHCMIQVPGFKSPLSKPKLASWGECANKLKNHNKTLFFHLEHWYEALRIVVQSWEEPKGLELAVLFLTMMDASDSTRLHELQLVAAGNLVPLICSFFRKYDTFPHLTHLTQELLIQKEALPTELRALVFVQQKTTAHVLAHHLNLNEELRIARLEAVPLHSTTTAPPTCSIKFTKKDETQNLRLFTSGERNVLIATTVAEEGMDIGAANCVIRFDPALTGVSFVQGRGRARQAQSAHIITAQHAQRSVETLLGVEEMQVQMAAEFVAASGPSIADRAKRR